MIHERRLVIIGEAGKDENIASSPLLAEAGELSAYEDVEWLFLYHGNMGIITESYNNRLITGYPVIALRETLKPFSDRVSRSLFKKFFARFLYAKKARQILTTTPIALDLIFKRARKSRIGFSFYAPDFTLLSTVPPSIRRHTSIFVKTEVEQESPTKEGAVGISSIKQIIEILVSRLDMG